MKESIHFEDLQDDKHFNVGFKKDGNNNNANTYKQKSDKTVFSQDVDKVLDNDVAYQEQLYNKQLGNFNTDRTDKDELEDRYKKYMQQQNQQKESLEHFQKK